VGEATTAAQLLGYGAATLHEACRVPNALPASIRPAWDGAALAGPAYPVRVGPGDNLALHWAIADAQPGEVIVADAHDSVHGHWGEVMAVGAQARGIAGLVIAGGVRDTREQAELGFPVFASSITVLGTAKRWAGTQGAPLGLGSVTVRRGDWIVADRDGAVVLPAEQLAEIIDRAQARLDKEATIMARLRAGSTTLEEYGLRDLDTPFTGA
jgi:4-hydroxy-4-methyl-2-oxoglutarate aldolase